MLKRICKATGCNGLATPPHKYCEKHLFMEREEQERRAHRLDTINPTKWPELYRSPDWKSIKEQQLRACPLCEKCGQPATEVHHITPHRGDPGLFFNPNNLMSLCHDCHTRETQKEIAQRQREQYQEIEKRKRTGKLWY